MLRQQKGIKQKTFAATTGISPTYLSQIETGVKEPATSVLKKIAEKLNVPLPIIFFLSMEKDDVPLKKRKAYETLGLTLKSMINTFFSEGEL